MSQTTHQTDRRVVLLTKTLTSVFAAYVAFAFAQETATTAPDPALLLATGAVFVAVYEGVTRIMVGSVRRPLLERLSLPTLGRGLLLTLAVTVALFATTIAIEAAMPGTPNRYSWALPVVGFEFRTNVVVPGVIMVAWYGLIRRAINRAIGRSGGGDSPEVPA